MRVAHKLDTRTKEKRGGAYIQLWGVVDGAVADAFNRHPDYLTEKGLRDAPLSIVKRVTGTVLGFALQEAQRQRELADRGGRPLPTDRQVSGVHASDAGAGVNFVSPNPHCRIGRVRFKRKHRYRSPDAFNLKTAELMAAVRRAGK